MLISTSMSFLNAKLKIAARAKYQWWTVVSYILYGLMAASLLFSAILVYNYTFRTLEDAHTIVLLNTDTVVNNVNMDMYKKAVNTINKKNVPSGFSENIRNIFSYGPAPVVVSTTMEAMPAQPVYAETVEP